MGTRKTTFGTRTELSTLVTELGSVVRFNSANFNSLSFSFVLDETLQLVERPVANPIVHSLSSSLFSYSSEVFHHYLVSVEIGNYVFTHVVINPSHITIFPTAKFPQKTLSRPCAFGLQFRAQIFEFSFDLFDFMRIIKPAVGRDSEVVYSKVNAKNTFLRSVVNGINLFGKGEQKETFAPLVHSQQTLIDIPTEVFFVAVRNRELNFDSAIDCSDAQDIIFEGSRAREVIPHRSSPDKRLIFSFLDHTAGLFDASNSELALQTEKTQMFIDKWMQFDVVFDLFIPSRIDTELQSFGIQLESADYLWSRFNLDFSSHNASHIFNIGEFIFKPYGGFGNSSPQQDCSVSLPTTL